MCEKTSGSVALNIDQKYSKEEMTGVRNIRAAEWKSITVVLLMEFILLNLPRKSNFIPPVFFFFPVLCLFRLLFEYFNERVYGKLDEGDLVFLLSVASLSAAGQFLFT